MPPAQSLPSGTTLGTSTVPVKLAWSATDNDSGVARYEVQQSTDGGPFTDVALASATQTSATLNLDPAKTYRFQVRAQDVAGNWSGWKQASAFKVNLLQEIDGQIVYAGTWTPVSLSGASGGGVNHASAAGASAKLTFAGGSSVAWVAPKGADRGVAEVWVDGAKVKSADLYASSAQPRKMIYAKSQMNPLVSHSIEVRVLGTKNASSSGTRVDIDALVVLSSP
jgi:hypothetical protein